MSLIIAEIGTSHEGSIEKARKLVDACVDSGADCIKFQWVYADEILHPNTGYVKLPTGNIRLYDRFKQLECPVEFYKEIQDYVHSKNCSFCCSPFGIKSMKELLSINPDYVKIASPELNHFPMLEFLAEYRKIQKAEGKEIVPVILSSGVSKLKDIEKAFEILGKEKVSLLHCITSYPAPESEYNLRLITNLKNIFGVECGLSDHSLDPILVPVLSVACGGSIIEKHITLSRQTEGLDDPVALEPEQFATMVHVVHQTEVTLKHYGPQVGYERIIQQLSEQYEEAKVFDALGDGVKKLAVSEEKNYGRTNRSLHFMKDYPSGYKLKEEDIGVLRTEKVLTPGIGPEFLADIVGSILEKPAEAGSGITWDYFK